MSTSTVATQRRRSKSAAAAEPSAIEGDKLEAFKAASAFMNEDAILGIGDYNANTSIATIDACPMVALVAHLADPSYGLASGVLEEAANALEVLWTALGGSNAHELSDELLRDSILSVWRRVIVAGSIDRRYRDGLRRRLQERFEQEAAARRAVSR